MLFPGSGGLLPTVIPASRGVVAPGASTAKIIHISITGLTQDPEPGSVGTGEVVEAGGELQSSASPPAFGRVT